MKKLIILCTLMGILGASAAQTATLTKEETVNYINKKIQETKGHYLKLDFGGSLGVKTMYYYSSNLKLDDNKIIYYRYRGTHKEPQSGSREYVSGHGYQTFYPCDYIAVQDDLSFAAENIVSIEDHKDNLNVNSPVGVVKLMVVNNTGIFKRTAGTPNSKFTSGDFYGRCTDYKEISDNHTVSEIYINYLKGDGSNFNKMRKALEYLRDLAKAEDDPFGG